MAGPPRWRQIGLVVSLGLALALAAGLVGLLAWRRSRREPGLETGSFTRLTDYPGRETFPTLCTVRTTDEGDIWMLSLDRAAPRR